MVALRNTPKGAGLQLNHQRTDWLRQSPSPFRLHLTEHQSNPVIAPLWRTDGSRRPAGTPFTATSGLHTRTDCCQYSTASEGLRSQSGSIFVTGFSPRFKWDEWLSAERRWSLGRDCIQFACVARKVLHTPRVGRCCLSRVGLIDSLQRSSLLYF